MARYKITLQDAPDYAMTASADNLEGSMNAAVQLLLYYGLEGSVDVYDTEDNTLTLRLTCDAPEEALP